MQWNSSYQESVFTFANNINTHEGGSHLSGFRSALTRTINAYGREKGLLKEKDPNLSGEDVREGPDRGDLGEARRAAVRGPDQDQARQPAGRGPRQGDRQPQARRVPRGEPDGREADRLEVRRRRPGPRRGAQGARPDPAQVGARELDASRQARGLLGQGPARRGDLHRRGRLGRRLGQAGPRPLDPGRPAAPRQDPERREEPDRQGALEHRDPGDDHGDRDRRPRGVQPRRRAVPQDHPGLRRRRRRSAHPHPGADFPLPPDARADRRGLRVHREAAALPRQAGQPLAATSRRSRSSRSTSSQTGSRTTRSRTPRARRRSSPPRAGSASTASSRSTRAGTTRFARSTGER